MTDVSDILAVVAMRDAGPRERLGFAMHYYRWLERLTAAMRDDMMLILEHSHGVAGLEANIANCEKVGRSTCSMTNRIILCKGWI